MSIQRFIYPSIWRDERFCSLSDKARLLYIGVITTSDDYGRRRAEPELLKADVFPLDRKMTLRRVIVLRNELNAAGLVRVYGDGHYMDLPKWSMYQKPKYLKPSKIPEFSAPDPGGTRAEPGPNKPGTRAMGLGLGSELGSILPSEEKPSASVVRRKLSESGSAVHQFLGHFAEAFEKHVGRKYMVKFGKEGKLVKEALKVYPLDELDGLLAQWWDTDTDFIREAGRSVGVFLSQIPKLLSALPPLPDPDAIPAETPQAVVDAYAAHLRSKGVAI
ncbi:MAG: hypothetical protein WC789_09505 [Lentisphaeria bacterium]